MQAKQGSGFWGRRRSHLIGCAMGLVAIFALAIPSLASAQFPTETYVGLGDSLAFGYSSQLYHEGEALGYEDPEGFEHGYVNAYFKSLNAKNKKAENGKSFRLRNDGCPNETTETMIGGNPALIGGLNFALKGAQEANHLPIVKGSNTSNPEGEDKEPCEYQAKWNAEEKVCPTALPGTPTEPGELPTSCGPLHHSYAGSQLEDAIALIKQSNQEGKPVTAITLNIGGNDQLQVLHRVEKEVKTEFIPNYVGTHEPQLHNEASAEAFVHCTKKAEKETGESSGPTFEAARNACLSSEGASYGEKAYKYKIGEAAAARGAELIHAAVAGEEVTGPPCPGTSECNNGLFAQILSNLLGIEAAIRKGGSLGGINYNGKILFQGGYNPYGKQFRFAVEGVGFVSSLTAATEPREVREKGGYSAVSGRCAVHAEKLELEEEAIAESCTAAALQIGFNALVSFLNLQAEGINTATGTCMTAPSVRFNPQKEKDQGKLEVERLEKWTGMTNGTRTKVGSEERFNGPDIHPTVAGYKELSAEMVKEETHRCHTQGYPGF